MNPKTKITSETISPSFTACPFFQQQVFHRQAQSKYLSEQTALHLEEVRNGLARFDLNLADEVAAGIKNWAMQHGASYFTHWFQPLTHKSGEKHDSFLAYNSASGSFILQFTGKDLFYGEPDASSFPTGGLRATHEARGYTAWDSTSFPFLLKNAEGTTLFIPALFYSWKGAALDHKIPLLRSNQKLLKVGLRLLNLCDIPAKRVYATLGIEQEYFLLEKERAHMRPDLVLAGRTLFGAKPAKAQELEDHYCGPVSSRVLPFMRAFEEEALRLGIPVKTRHNEVAPCQYEVAPLFENASIACEHNLLLMQVMQQVAERYGLVCLFHEKPFAGFNGSGKHNNWSIASDQGINFLDPNGNSLVFLTTLAAVLWGVYEHAGLLRASIGSADNDCRLGGSEAPPSILSIFLGEALEQLIQDIVQEKPLTSFSPKQIDLGLMHMPLHTIDIADRNRTSFFVFTGNKFEFRAVGAQANCAFPIAILNSIVADSLQLILDEIEDARKGKSSALSLETALIVLRKYFREAQPILFGGNNYSSEWHQEAKDRALPNFSSSFQAFHELLEKKSIRVLETVFTEKEIASRFEILVEQYAKTIQIEMNLMLTLLMTQIVPSVQKDLSQKWLLLKAFAESGAPFEAQRKLAQETNHLLEEAIQQGYEIRSLEEQSSNCGWEAKGKIFAELIRPKMQQLRKIVDALEVRVDRDVWRLATYQELLF